MFAHLHVRCVTHLGTRGRAGGTKKGTPTSVVLPPVFWPTRARALSSAEVPVQLAGAVQHTTGVGQFDLPRARAPAHALGGSPQLKKSSPVLARRRSSKRRLWSSWFRLARRTCSATHPRVGPPHMWCLAAQRNQKQRKTRTRRSDRFAAFLSGELYQPVACLVDDAYGRPGLPALLEVAREHDRRGGREACAVPFKRGPFNLASVVGWHVDGKHGCAGSRRNDGHGGVWSGATLGWPRWVRLEHATARPPRRTGWLSSRPEARIPT